MPNPAHEALLQPELLRGERIVWTGQPDRSVIFNIGDLFFVPFSLVWEGFVVIATLVAVGAFSERTFQVAENGASLFKLLILTLFNFVGIYLLVGRFLYKDWVKRRTYFALTNKRALILAERMTRKLDSVFLDAVSVINKSVRRNGVGTVRFGSTNWMDALYGTSGMNLFGGISSGGAPAFHDIRDADAVYALAQQQRAAGG